MGDAATNDEAIGRDPRPQACRWTAWAVLAIGLATTVLAFSLTRRAVETQDRERFDHLRDGAVATFKLHTEFYLNHLKSVRGLFEATEALTAGQLREFLLHSGAREGHTGFLDIGFSQRVAAEERERHEREQRAQGWTNYAVVGASLDPAVLFPVTCFESFLQDGFDPRGWNQAGESNRWLAMQAARDRDEPIATARLELMAPGRTNMLAGFIIFLPVYRHSFLPEVLTTPAARGAALAGFVFGSFATQECWDNVVPSSDREVLAMRVYDGAEARPERLLFDSRLGSARRFEGGAARFEEQILLGDLGREWLVQLAMLPGFARHSKAMAPWGVLVAGLVVSGLLFSLAQAEARGRARAEAMGQKLRRSEVALRDSERDLRSIFGSIQDVFYRAEPGGAITMVSPSCTALGGYTPAEMVGRRAVEFFARAEDRERLARRLFSAGSVQDYEVELRTKDGQLKSVSLTAQVVRDERGQVVGSEGIVRDISARKTAERSLRESEANLRLIYEDAPVMMFTFDEGGRIRSANRQWLAATGCAAETAVGRRLDFLMTPESAGAVSEAVLARFWQAGTLAGLAGQYVRKGGQVLEVVLDAVATRNQQGERLGLAVVRDVTGQLRAEAARRESEALYQSLVESLPHCVYRKDAAGRIVFANYMMCFFVGKARESIVGKTDFEVLPPEVAEQFRREDIQVLTSGKVFEEVKELAWPQGARTFWHVVKSPIYDAGGRAVGTQGVFWSVTEERLGQLALAEEKQRLATTLACIADGVITTDTAGRTLLMNSVAEALTGWTQAEAVGRSLSEVFRIQDSRTRSPLADPVAAILAGGGLRENTGQTVLVSREGTERAIGQSGAPIRDGQGRVSGVVIVFRDVSDLVKQDLERLNTSKLESVGLLAGGIAHDFNNILLAVLGNLSLAREFAADGAQVQRHVGLAEEAAQRAKALTQQLLTFARGGAPIKRTVWLREVMLNAMELPLRGTSVRCEPEVSADLWPVEVDPAQIGQVISHLVLNAVQAMPQGGLLRVSAANVELSRASGLPLAAGRYVRLAFQDEGQGIPHEHLPKIFDPYFTTKPRGTGLGLSAAYSIVRRHGGHIAVESALGRGTRFEVYLSAASDESPRPQRVDGPVRPGSGRVLVMDDDPAVRQVVRTMLRRLGYRAEEAGHGLEAIRLYQSAREAGDPFDVVILDLTVPGGLGGKEAVARLRAYDPQVKAVVSSGYSDDPVMAHHQEYGFRAVVEKPYRLEDLSRVLAQVMAPPTPEPVLNS